MNSSVFINTKCYIMQPLFEQGEIVYRIIITDNLLSCYYWVEDNYPLLVNEFNSRIIKKPNAIYLQSTISIGGLVISERPITDLNLTVQQVKDMLYKQFKIGFIGLYDKHAEVTHYNDTTTSDAVITALIHMCANDDEVEVITELKNY